MIFLSAGHHLKDPGAIANGVQENKLAIELRDKICRQLKDAGVEYETDRDDETLALYLARIKPTSSSLTCELHFNAATPTATGIEVIVAENASFDSRRLAEELCRTGSEILRIPNRGVKTEKQTHRGQLAIMRKPGKVALVEVCFITNKQDLMSYESNKHVLSAAWANILKQHSKR